MTTSVTVKAKKHTCKYLRAWISRSELQCNYVHGVRVDDMRVQCRYMYTCSSEYPEKCPEISI